MFSGYAMFWEIKNAFMSREGVECVSGHGGLFQFDWSLLAGGGLIFTGVMLIVRKHG